MTRKEKDIYDWQVTVQKRTCIGIVARLGLPEEEINEVCNRLRTLSTKEEVKAYKKELLDKYKDKREERKKEWEKIKHNYSYENMKRRRLVE